jgi:hypothetical protein
MTIGPVSNSPEILRFKSHDGLWESVVRRVDEVRGESDILFINSHFGAMARVFRRDYTWQEQRRSRFGFGRLKRGVLLNAVEGSLPTEDSKAIGALLLSAYFQLAELQFNTDLPSG